ncbi:MAG: DnaJ domain-containing protein [Synechococcales bacterium]|nr:DnaJ domain-containing protein [Synechococcales bacterium]
MIRERFLNALKFLTEESTERGYKPAWIWYQLLNCFENFYPEELESVAHVLGYRAGWAFHQKLKLIAEDRLLEESPEASPENPNEWALKALGITPPIDRGKIKEAYRKLAKKLHPDAGGDAAQFRRVRQAYETLMEVVA